MAKTTSENNNNTPIHDNCNHIDEQKQNDKYTVIRNHLRLQNTTLAWQTTVKGGTVNETKKRVPLKISSELKTQHLTDT